MLASYALSPSGRANGRFDRFASMLRVGVPVEAVRIKMRVEGCPSSEIDNFLEPPSPEAAARASFPSALTAVSAPTSNPSPPPPAAARAAPAAARRFPRFETMLIAGVPREAVRMKMRAEGYPPAAIDAFIDSAPSSRAPSNPNPPNMPNLPSPRAPLTRAPSPPPLPPPPPLPSPPPSGRAPPATVVAQPWDGDDDELASLFECAICLDLLVKARIDVAHQDLVFNNQE